MDCSPPGSSLHGISQARIVEWVTISFSRGPSWPRNWTRISCIEGGFFTTEPPGKPKRKTWGSANLLWVAISELGKYRKGVMRREEMFIREGGCPSGSWKVSLICLQHLHTPFLLHLPAHCQLAEAQSPAVDIWMQVPCCAAALEEKKENQWSPSSRPQVDLSLLSVNPNSSKHLPYPHSLSFAFCFPQLLFKLPAKRKWYLYHAWIAPPSFFLFFFKTTDLWEACQGISPTSFTPWLRLSQFVKSQYASVILFIYCLIGTAK